jgi:hypothetical protein
VLPPPAGAGITTEIRTDDASWVADVLVRHPDWTVTLEAHLPQISLIAIQDRQEQYRQVGIRDAWLVGYDIARLEVQRDLPIFRLEAKQAERLEPAVIGSTTDGAPARTSLAKFTERLLTGRVRFEGPPPQAGAPLVATVPSVCWKCCRDTYLVLALINLPAYTMFAPRGILPARDPGKLPEALAVHQSAIPTLNRACGSLTSLRRPPPSRIATGMRVHCPWFDAPISLQKLPETTLAPCRWHHCWTFAGKVWAPSKLRGSRWTWSGSAD